MLCRYGGQRHPLPGKALPPVELNHAFCPPAAKPVGQAQRNKKTDLREAFENTANGRVIKMIVMIMGDDDRIKLIGSSSSDVALPDTSDPFIGEYVAKLKDVVESYQLKFGFKDATDEAVISVRDDIQNIRQVCAIDSANLLYNSAKLEPGKLVNDAKLEVGWEVKNCTADAKFGPCAMSVGLSWSCLA